mgnify:CR=1 FL=1
MNLMENRLTVLLSKFWILFLVKFDEDQNYHGFGCRERYVIRKNSQNFSNKSLQSLTFRYEKFAFTLKIIDNEVQLDHQLILFKLFIRMETFQMASNVCGTI